MNASPRRTQRAQLHVLAESLALPRKWTIVDLTAALERECGSTIVWMPIPEGFPRQLCGVRLTGPGRTVLCYRPSSDPSIDRRSCAHAAAHLLLANGRAVSGESRVAAALVTGDHVDDDEVDDFRAECEADLLAAMILRAPTRRSRRGRTRCTAHPERS